jgi:hypothetical protein
MMKTEFELKVYAMLYSESCHLFRFAHFPAAWLSAPNPILSSSWH